jgi:hypothetical protein
MLVGLNDGAVSTGLNSALTQSADLDLTRQDGDPAGGNYTKNALRLTPNSKYTHGWWILIKTIDLLILHSIRQNDRTMLGWAFLWHSSIGLVSHR